MNLAIADAADVAQALIRWYREGDRDRLDTYATRRLREFENVKEFSGWLLRLLRLSAAEGCDPDSALRSRLAVIERIAEPGPCAAAFARQYAGSDEVSDRSWTEQLALTSAGGF
jgi:p-hydroxybenzoate 3-monooxygenase